jgi:uncharacterized protein YegP (UPF0339 family)
VANGAHVTAVYFEIEHEPQGWTWRIRSLANHEILCHSERLGSRETCLHAIGLVRASAGQQEWYWDRERQPPDWTRF